MIEALIAGKLHGKPEQRTARSGRAFVTARLRTAAGADEVLFVRVTAFSDSAGAALLALDDGDAVALAGTATPGAWLDRDGNPKPNLDLVAAQVLTAYHLKRRRDAMQPTGASDTGTTPAPAAPPPRASARRTQPDADDFGPAGADDWLQGEGLR